MKFAAPETGETLVGMAYGPGAADLVVQHRDRIDYLEMPFEQLRHAPALGDIQNDIPLILHCASLSIAGFVSPQDAVLDDIDSTAKRMKTPWIGEHLAYVTAEPFVEEEGRDSRPTSLNYTVCPQYNEELLDNVAKNLATLAPKFDVPVILENPPQYFASPDSTMSQIDFLRALAERCDVRFILDLSHYAITAYNDNFDPVEEFDRLPLERVVEVHMSGHSLQSGIMWDDHAVCASETSFDLLERLLDRARPSAITFEYNWDRFPDATIASHLDRTHELIQRA